MVDSYRKIMKEQRNKSQDEKTATLRSKVSRTISKEWNYHGFLAVPAFILKMTFRQIKNSLTKSKSS